MSLEPARRARRALFAAVAAGALLRVAFVDRPLDARLRTAWRQADSVQIARNFWREDPDIRHPRIDWRGDTPGLVEMELPALPWAAGMLYRALGYHEAILRVLSCLFETGSLVLVAWLAARILPAGGAALATAAYALNPLAVYLSTAMQPEPLMLFLSLAAMILLLHWLEGGRDRWLIAAAAALALAVLAKAPAACLGAAFAWALARRGGWRVFLRPAALAAGVVAILPGALWYLSVKRYFVLYGHSLGLSNQDPFLGLDMLWPPTFAARLLLWETLTVVTPAGWILLAAGARAAPDAGAAAAPGDAAGRGGREGAQLAWAWLVSSWLFQIAAARTTSHQWAFYYHGLSAVPACLLMGLGFAALRASGSRRRRGAAAWVAALVLVSLAGSTGALLWARDHRPELETMRACGLRFLPSIPEGAAIVVRGGTMSEAGHALAHDQSMLFAWLDRKGFTYGDEALSVATLESIAARGGRFWIADDEERGTPRGAAAAQHFLEIDRCPGGYSLYDLRRPAPPAGAAPGPGGAP